MSNTDFLGRAIETVKKAIDQDTAGEYEKAYQIYYQARGYRHVDLGKLSDISQWSCSC